MKLYADYIKEREDIETVYDDNCFITYRKIDEDSVFVYDMFSSDEVRGTKVMLSFCKDFVGKLSEEGIKNVYGSTEEDTQGWERSDKVLRDFGFKFIGKDPNRKYINNYCLEL